MNGKQPWLLWENFSNSMYHLCRLHRSYFLWKIYFYCSIHVLQVVLIFSVSGACRTDELVNLCIDDVEVHGPMYLVKIPKSETCPARSFAICDQYFDIVKKYHQLRPPNVPSNRFFLNYQKGKCTMQVIEKNKFCRMAQEIALFLKLEDADRYTGN